MSRWKASLIHLSLSISIAAIVLTLMLLLWFAPPFFSAAGGHDVLLIMLAVDVTLGPFITLIIFDLKKSRRALLFDFSVIAMLQISALVYGLTVMFHARPVYVVFSKGSFDLVTENMLDNRDLAKVRYPQFGSPPFSGQVYAYTEMPTDPREINEVVMTAFSGKDLPQYPQYYKPLTEHAQAVAAAAKPIQQLRNLNPGKTAEIDSAIHAARQSEQDLGFVPLRAKFEDLAVIVSRRDGKIQTILALQPWKN